MSKRGLSLLVLVSVVLIVLPFISSAQVNVQSFSNHKVEVRALVAGSIYTLIESFYGSTDVEGMFSQEVSVDPSEFDIKIWIKNGNDVVVTERFDGISSTDTLNVIMFPGKIEVVESFEEPETVNDTPANNTVEEIINDTVNETINNSLEEESLEIEKDSPEGTGITGLSTTEDTGFLSGSSFYYIIGIVVLLAIGFLGFMGYKKIAHTKQPKQIKVKKLSELRKEQEEGKEAVDDHTDSYRKEIDEAEKKIEEAQQEIRRLKNEGKIKDMRKKIEEEKKALERLEKGED